MDNEAPRAAERLVQTIARAFYPDEIVVILDFLLADKYLKNSEMETRIGMPGNKLRALINRLVNQERFLKEEEVFEDNKMELYYYLDYNHFVNVIRYRMHKMLKLIDAMGDSRVDNIMYECPKCKTKYDIYKALKRRNKHYKFCCDNEGCCPYMEHSQCEDAPYTLVQVAKTGQDEVQKLREKVRSQLHEDISARGSRAGIYDLLDKIGGTKLPHNFPSESRRFGIGYLPAIDYGKDGGKGKGEEGKKGGTGLFYEAAASGFGQKREAGLLEKISGETDLLEPAMKVAKTGPSFLEGSRVVREEDLMASMGAEGLKNGGLKEEEGEKEQPKQMTEEERQAEFRRQYLQAFALKQKEESMVKVEEEEEKKEEGEEEDFEWEAGDT